MKEIDEEGIQDFYYVSLVDDMNVHAEYRTQVEYNLYYWPTVFFDGGFEVVLGAESIPAAKAAYEAAIINCGDREVPDVEATLTVYWIGDATMEITVSIQNNEPELYEGHIRTFVTEIESSMGWNDTGGNPYTYAFLDYAFDEDITINTGNTWESSVIWNGYEHDDGYGNDFGGITQENIVVIAAVYNAEWHQGYAYPPDQNPFDAYYVDEVTGATPTILEYAVDDEDQEFITLTGNWNSAVHPNAHNGSGRFTGPGTGMKKAGWRVDTLILPGTYDVYVWKFEHEFMQFMATDVHYKVWYKDGFSDWILVDQSTSGNEWVYLGTFEFDNSHIQGILITDEADGFVIADAIKMTYIGP